MSARLKIFMVLFLCALLSFQIGCGSSGGGGSSSGGTTTVASIVVSAGSDTIVANGVSQVRITATVTDTAGDSVVNGTTLTFSTTAGDFNSALAGIQSSTTAGTTDGIASALLTSPTNVGFATVTVSVSGVSSTVTIEFVASAVAQIVITADPNNLTADGISSSLITASVLDANGNAVPDGETITFKLVGPGSISSPTAQTANGIAVITYTSGTQLLTATITAESTNATVSESVDITLIRAIIGSLTSSASSTNLVANGVSQSSISVTVRDENGNLIDDGTPVTFTTTAGSLALTRQGNEQTVTVPTINGVAVATLTSSTNIGTATVTITAGGVSTSIVFNFVAGSVNAISVTANPTNLTADGVSTSTIRAAATDINGNAIANGEVISFSITSGTGQLSSPTASIDSGAASVTYTAGTSTGTVTIQAESTNGVSATVNVSLISVLVANVDLTAGTSQIIADGKSEASFRAVVTDSNGNNVPNNTIVTFTTTAGTFKDPTIGTVNGIATGILVSSTNIGVATIMATAGGISDTATIQFIAGAARNVKLTAIPTTLTADGVSVAQLRAEITDIQNNPVANGEVITFSIESGSGTIGPPLSSSTVGGVAFGTFTAPSTTGSTTIVAQTTTGNRGRVTIPIVAPDIASISVTANPASIIADGSLSVIRAAVVYVNGQDAADGTTVNFSTTAGTFTNGLTTQTVATVGGIATVNLESSNLPETATVMAEADGVTGQTQVAFTAVPGFFSLSLSQTSVKSDNSNSATITATVLDANRVPIPNVTVAFKTSVNGTFTGGQLSSSTAVTDENGEASIEFRSGTVEKKNQTVTIEASIPANPELGTKQVPIQITGTTISLSTTNTNLEIDPANPGKASSTLSITVKDAGDIPISDAQVTITMSASGLAIVNPVSGQTNVNGVLNVTVTGTSAGAAAGQVTVIASSLGTQNSQLYRIGAVGQVFGITSPTPISGQDYVGLATCQDPNTCCVDPNSSDCGLLDIQVNAPTSANVRFSTTMGFFQQTSGTDAKVISKAVSGGTVSAKLYSSTPGIATVQVFDLDDPTIKDTLLVAISAPSAEAAKISLQANSTIVAPSSDEIKNTVTLTVTVKTITDQVVGGAPVAFSIIDSTGGGETILPVVIYTDIFGSGSTTFTSGYLSSDALGVHVQATIVDTTITDTISIVIGGAAGSVIISRGTQVESVNNNTAYKLPMSVIVVDSNGNPVSGALVSLGAWPLRYATGQWIQLGTECVIQYTSPFIDNEDDPERNLILDPGEDLNGDLQLTPPSAAAGSLPATVTTNADGVGEFNLIYLKGSAAWIFDEISASTRVLGTETESIYTFTLPWLAGEECFLPNSSYDAPIPEEGSISITADDTTLPADETSTTNVMATVVDGSGVSVPDGEVVTFTLNPSDSGELSSATATTTNGIATVVYTVPGEAGSVMITATTADGLFATLTITLTPVVGQVKLAAPATTGMEANGTDVYTLTAQVLDLSGKPISGNSVTFSAFGNTGIVAFNPVTTVTGSDGTATSLVSDISSSTDTMTIRATSGGVNSSPLPISFTGFSGGGTTMPAAVNVTAVSETLNPNNNTTVTATVFDSSGGTIEGVNVLFTLDNPVLGYITSNANTNSSGQANVTFTARNLAGEVNITATAGSVSNDPPKTIFILDQTSPANIALVANPTSIIVQGTCNVQATVTDALSNPVANGTRVTFEVANTLFGTITASAITNAGIATASFQASNNPGTATINVSSGSASATVNINVDQAPPSSIEFVSATPNVIAIKQSGGNETSTIQFRVKNSNGIGLEGINVSMMMTGPNGGEFIDSSGDGSPETIDVSTNASGIAQVILHSGFVAGPVTVKATITVSAGPPVVTSIVQSSVVSIGGGVPSEKFFSLAASFLNVAGLTINNKTTDITAFLADRFGNFNVLTGTTVSFVTEVGLTVDTSAVTTQDDGLATITARSQIPAMGSAPEDVLPLAWETSLMTDINTKYGTVFTTHPRDGLCSVLVYTKGEEHFTDTNGNGLFDTGETIFNTIIDPFIDYNDDDLYSNDGPGGEPDEIFIDANGDTVWTDATGDLGWNSNKYIFGNFKILLTGPPIIRFDTNTFTVAKINSSSASVDILICDANMNPLAPGTTVRISVDAGKVGGRIEHDYANSNVIGPDEAGHRALIEYPVVISDADPLNEETATSTLTVEVTWEGTVYRSSISGTIDD